MKHLLFLALPALLAAACAKRPAPSEMAGAAAKQYYDFLVAGDCRTFAEGYWRPDSIPDSYREQLVDNIRMFAAQQDSARHGIKDVVVSKCAADTARHRADVFLVLAFGDSTAEEVFVPMVEHAGVWYME